MQLFQLFLAATAAKAVAAAQAYSTWMADSFIARGVDKAAGYTQATLYYSFENLYNATKNETYYNFIVSQIDGILNESGQISTYNASKLSLDDIRIGTVLLYLYGQTNATKYKTAADQLRGGLNIQPRTPSGGFFHRFPAYPNQMWLDGIYMAEPFYAMYTARFEPGNQTAWNDIIKQFDLIESHCRNKTSGLLYHGYDESGVAVWADPVTGACPHIWDRAVGWYFMALIDILDWFPKSHPGHARLIKYFTTLAVALKKAQDTSGGWWLIMDEPYPGMAGNYIESSGTAMFTYGFLKGIRKGYLKARDYKAPAKKAYDLMTTRFVANNGTGGTLNWEGTVLVGSLSSNGSYEYYISVPLAENDLKGVGPFISSSVEIENLK